MKRMLKYLVVLVPVLLGCRDDLFETDISEKAPEVIIPQDNLITTNMTVHFKWYELEGATGYRLQIVSPQFNNILEYELDSLITGTEFYYTLDPGTYEWRLRAENNAYQSLYSPIQTLQIDSTNDLTGQTVTLLIPGSNEFLNESNPSFSWDALSIADGYDIIIKSGSNWSTGTVVESSSVVTNSYTTSSSLPEGEYTWGVQATNTTSATSYFTRSFTLDLTVPSPPTLISPDGDVFNTSQQFTYSWTRAIDNGAYPSALSDSVYVYDDAALTSLYKRFETSNTSYVDSIPTAGTYYWRVKTFDAAGNIGSFSTSNSFTVQ